MGKIPSRNVTCVCHDGLGESGKRPCFVIARLDRVCPGQGDNNHPEEHEFFRGQYLRDLAGRRKNPGGVQQQGP
jgi:hypothetical protein